MKSEQQRDDHNQFVDVAVSTTSGRWPHSDFEQVPAHEPVRVVLDKAGRELKLTDTSNWVVEVDGQTIRPNSSYDDNGLQGQVVIDWGPGHGGGGA